MIALIEEHRDELEALCRRYHVRKLELFGSAARGDFDPERSDLDFLVEFLEIPEGQSFRTFFGLRFALAELYGREVDLVMTKALRNPYFIADISDSRVVLYAAA
jgi:hypothetical protein